MTPLRIWLPGEPRTKKNSQQIRRSGARLAQRTDARDNTASGKLENGILGMCGEAGECADLLKKYLYQGHELERDKLAEETGDVLWYVAETAAGLGLTLEDIAKRNIEKLKRRYPDGFDAERSRQREGGQA